MSKQYWITDPSETSVFISFESRGQAEDWMREKQAFVTSETSILYQAKIVEMERQKPILDQIREVLGPAIKAAQSRVGANVRLKDDEALIEAGKLLGVER